MVKIDGKPRLCKLAMWPDFDGYGFNLHAEKSRPGQYVGKVDEGSPAEAAGLREGDKIIQVNGTNISSENHKQVVSRIKSIPNETELLVVDVETERVYREAGTEISREDAVVISSSTSSSSKELSHAQEVQEETEDEDRKSIESTGSSIDKRTLDPSESSPAPGKIRSCHIIKNEPSESFGFSIQTVKKENTKVIKEISPDGPAERAGLHLDDIVLAVNGEDVIEENHKAVVERIVSRSLDTTLLVTDKDTFNQCREHDIPFLPSTESFKERERMPKAPGSSSSSSRTSTTIEATIESSPRIVIEEFTDKVDPGLHPSVEGHVTITHINPSNANGGDNDILVTKEISVDDDEYTKSVEMVEEETSIAMGSTGNSPSPRSTPSPQFSHPSGTHSPVSTRTESPHGELDLNMTAAQMRERISAKKKRDPRKDDRMDILRKYQIIQTL